MKRNILTIFLASPGDLQEERSIVRDTVARANKILSQTVGWHVELLGWEDTLPGGSRPQSLINIDVDSCQLFLGILWRRWGQETGKYSSGFEEEFLRAQERRRTNGSPEIWVFFKEVDEDYKKDPGAQLKRVLDFKNDLIKSKELLFKEFSGTTWEKTIFDTLLRYVLELSKKESEIESQEESALTGKARESHPVKESKTEKHVESYPSGLISLFNKVNEMLNEGRAFDLDSSNLTRLYLQSSAWFSANHAGEVFGIHETNLVYKKRRNLELTNSEAIFLQRTFISDKQDIRPGWYWVKEESENEIDFLIAWLAAMDWNIDVRRDSVKSFLQIPLRTLFSRVFIDTIMPQSFASLMLGSL